MKDKNKAYFFTGMVVLFWSTIPSAFKISLRYLSIIELLLYSTFISLFVLFIILMFKKKISLIKTFKKKDYLYSALLGFLNPFFYYFVIFKVYSLLPAQQAQPLNMTWGIILVLISIPILKQKIKLTDIFAVFLSFFGVIIISTEGNLSYLHVKNYVGVLLAVGSSFIWAFYWILNIKDKKDPLLRLFFNFVFASIFILLSYILFFNIKTPVFKGILGACYVGMFEMGVTYALWIHALKLAKTTASVTILIFIVPFISFIFVYIFVGEKILVSSVIGAVLIVTGIVLNKYRAFKTYLGNKKGNKTL